jgi:hypothetical protein
MSDEELFASLSEYLEDIKFGVFDALSQNLDKLSLKFLQICDKQEKFEKYLKALKEKWKTSTSMRSLHRHDDKILKSAKQYVNRLAATETAKSKSPRKAQSRIHPQIHTSEYYSINQYNSRNSISKHSHGQSISSVQDMPLNESKIGANSVSSRATYTPGKQNNTRVSQLNSPGRSPLKKNTYSPSPQKKQYSAIREKTPDRSALKQRSVERSPAKFELEKPANLIVSRTTQGGFIREVIDPLINRILF